MTDRGWRPVVEAVVPADPTPYLELLERRFGISPSLFDDYVFFQPNKDGLWIVNRDLKAPLRPDAHVLGMPFFRIDMRFPRPSTNAVLKFGHLAVRNTVELDGDQIAAALYRRTLRPDPAKLRTVAGNGYVILKFRNRPLGLAYFRPLGNQESAEEPDVAEGAGELTAMCPKMWTSKLGVQPPAQRPMPWDTEDKASSEG